MYNPRRFCWYVLGGSSTVTPLESTATPYFKKLKSAFVRYKYIKNLILLIKTLHKGMKGEWFFVGSSYLGISTATQQPRDILKF
jgi:hypothetical protein